MKHLFVFLALAGFAVSVTAQTIVSTSPQPKNVVLEEYTGINCPYCPDGHRIANELMETYPGRVFAINIHQGSYASPSTGQPDYRTSFGDALAGQTNLTGYPCGTINRHVFSSPAPMTAGGTAHGRGNWNNCANQIMAVTSPVNVAIDASLNEATREISILLEVYYTSNEAMSTNKVNIAVLQDYVLGPQSGSSYNPDYIFGTQYYHMHMLRTLLFGQWGITIPTTTAGTFWDTAFVYTVPANYGAIPAELFDLALVAFVSQGNQEILSGDEYRIPYALDAGVKDIANVPSMVCGTTPFSPTFTLFNNGSTTITSATIDYTIDGGAASTINFTGSLAMGDDTVITLPAITPSANGSHTLEIVVSDPNSGTDNQSFNDEIATSFVTFVTNITMPQTQNFASTTFPPADWASLDAGGDGANWARGSAGHTAAGSAFINFYNISSGQTDDLMLSPADFSTMNNATMSFWVAYRQYSSENDKLQVDVSTNCGTTWTNEWQKSGTSLATGADVTSNWTSPSASEWREELIDLSDYDGMSDVMIRIRATSAYGNNLFVDDINIDEALSVNPVALDASLSIYPNPATDYITVSASDISAQQFSVTIFNANGDIVMFSDGHQSGDLVNINTGDLDNGSYIVQVQSGNGFWNSPLVINR